MVYVESFLLQWFFICFLLICGFDCYWYMAMPLCLWCYIVVCFSLFSLYFLVVFFIYHLRVLGIGWVEEES